LEVKTKVDEAVRLALERCVEVVGELRGILDEYANSVVYPRAGANIFLQV